MLPSWPWDSHKAWHLQGAAEPSGDQEAYGICNDHDIITKAVNGCQALVSQMWKTRPSPTVQLPLLAPLPAAAKVPSGLGAEDDDATLCAPRLFNSWVWGISICFQYGR